MNRCLLASRALLLLLNCLVLGFAITAAVYNKLAADEYVRSADIQRSGGNSTEADLSAHQINNDGNIIEGVSASYHLSHTLSVTFIPPVFDMHLSVA
jgi:hypothetical protein